MTYGKLWGMFMSRQCTLCKKEDSLELVGIEDDIGFTIWFECNNCGASGPSKKKLTARSENNFKEKRNDT